jgi:hypothetical protein
VKCIITAQILAKLKNHLSFFPAKNQEYPENRHPFCSRNVARAFAPRIPDSRIPGISDSPGIVPFRAAPRDRMAVAPIYLLQTLYLE